ARHRDGRVGRGPQARDPSASDAVGVGDGERRGLLRAEHARLQAEAQVAHVAATGFEATEACRRHEDRGLQSQGIHMRQLAAGITFSALLAASTEAAQFIPTPAPGPYPPEVEAHVAAAKAAAGTDLMGLYT